MTRNLKVLLSAYACRPGEGSEPSVGWNVARELVKHHQVWVITRGNNRPYIEAELQRNPIPGLNVIYCETPQGLVTFTLKQPMVYLHYYLWQIQAYFTARQLHQEVGFNLVHHLTYVRYSSPSFLALLPIPFIWGPVGGAESTPQAFWQDFSNRGKVYEIGRHLVHRLGELDPFVRLTAQRSVLARGTTADTTHRLSQLGATKVEVVSQLGLSSQEIARLNQGVNPNLNPIRFISIGRLLHWKGFHLGLRGFAQANLGDDAQYWIIGHGPELNRLQRLAKTLGIDHQVKFWGELSRQETFAKLKDCLALIHPSLHDSGGLVCLEAMAAGCPVICLNLGGPALAVTETTGFKVEAQTPEQVVQDLAEAIATLAKDPELSLTLGRCAQQRIEEVYSWNKKGRELAQLYESLIPTFPAQIQVLTFHKNS